MRRRSARAVNAGAARFVVSSCRQIAILGDRADRTQRVVVDATDHAGGALASDVLTHPELELIGLHCNLDDPDDAIGAVKLRQMVAEMVADSARAQRPPHACQPRWLGRGRALARAEDPSPRRGGDGRSDRRCLYAASLPAARAHRVAQPGCSSSGLANSAASAARPGNLPLRSVAQVTCGPHSPIGRGSGLKIRTVSVRVRLGALRQRR